MSSLKQLYQAILVLTLVSIALFASASKNTNYLNQGNEAYLKGNLVDAMKLYSKAGKTCIDETDKIDNNKALVFASRGKYDLAIARLTKAIDYNPSNGNVYYNRGILQIIKKAYPTAVSDFENAMSLGLSTEQNVIYNIAMAHYLGGDIDRAKDYLNSSSGIDHQDARVPYLNGLILYRNNEFANAVRSFKHATSIENNEHITYALGLAEYYGGNQDQGLSILENLKNKESFASNYHTLLANLAYDSNDLIAAKNSYQTALKKNKKDSEAWAGLGNIAMHVDDIVSAKEHFSQALRYNNKNINALNGIARIEFLNENYDEAIAAYDKTITLNSTNKKALYGKALAAMNIPDPYTCLDALALIEKKDLSPHQVEKVVILEARALGICNKKKQAVKLLQKYRSVAQNKLEIKTLLAYYYLRMFQYGNTISSISISKYKESLPYLLAGHASLHRGEHSSAYRFYRKAFKIDPEHPDVLMGAALCMIELNMEKEALRVIDSLEVRFPNSYHVFNSKGIIYKDLGLRYQQKNLKEKANTHFDIAAAAFKRAVKIRPELKTSFDNNIGLTYYYKNDIATANKLFDESQRLASINNRALVEISQGNYSNGIAKLDSLNREFIRKNNVPNNSVKNNLALARKRAPMNNNYKFITYYFLHQDVPPISPVNPFQSNTSVVNLPIDLKPDINYILEYSDIECEDVDRERKKKKKSKPKLKFLKKKKSTKCPIFKT